MSLIDAAAIVLADPGAPALKRQNDARGDSHRHGGAGFVGSHVADALLADGRRGRGRHNLSTSLAENVADAADLEFADITNSKALDDIVDAARRRQYSTLAAQSSVTVSVTIRDATARSMESAR